MANKAITHKRGDTLTLVVEIPPEYPDGYFVGWTVTSEIRNTADALIDTFAVTWADNATTRALKLQCMDTTLWPLAQVQFDVQLVSPASYVMSTDTVTIYVQKDITL